MKVKLLWRRLMPDTIARSEYQVSIVIEKYDVTTGGLYRLRRLERRSIVRTTDALDKANDAFDRIVRKESD
jgi:hypothetical protein